MTANFTVGVGVFLLGILIILYGVLYLIAYFFLLLESIIKVLILYYQYFSAIEFKVT